MNPPSSLPFVSIRPASFYLAEIIRLMRVLLVFTETRSSFSSCVCVSRSNVECFGMGQTTKNLYHGLLFSVRERYGLVIVVDSKENTSVFAKVRSCARLRL